MTKPTLYTLLWIIAAPYSAALATTKQVRIAVQISEVSQIHTAISGSSQIRLHTDQEIRHSLRGPANEENTFYFNGWRIDTKPIDQTSGNSYQAELSIYRVINIHTGEEMALNKINVKGALMCDAKNICDLVSDAETLLTNDQKILIGKIKIGKSLAEAGKLKLAKQPGP